MTSPFVGTPSFHQCEPGVEARRHISDETRHVAGTKKRDLSLTSCDWLSYLMPAPIAPAAGAMSSSAVFFCSFEKVP